MLLVNLKTINDKINFFRALSSFTIILVGIIISMGWILNFSILLTPSINYAPNTLSSALCFILLGTSIFIQKRIRRYNTTLTLILPLLVIFIGLFTLIDYIMMYISYKSLMGQIFGFQSTEMLRMSITTALSFILVGLAILNINNENWKNRNNYQYLALIVFFIMYFISLGYIYQTNVFNLQGAVQPSIYGTIIFIIITLSVICTYPDRGIIGILTSNRVSGSFGRVLIPSILFLPLIIGELRLLGELNGLYDLRFGVAIMAFFTSAILFILLLKSLNSIDELDINRMKAEKQLLETLEKLEVSNKELESFAYITSHDLQEPLRTIGNYAGLLKRRYEGQLDKDADDFLDFMVNGAMRMQNMVRGLLEYSRIDTKKDNYEEINAEEPVNEALINLNAAIKESNAEIIVDPLPIIRVDNDLIIHVFQNLIGNAIKFNREGIKPKIYISAQEGNKEWVFSISDNGIGMDQHYTDKIFEVFRRLHPVGEHNGVGIGLAMVKKVIDKHGGRIWVESELGKGSTFYFTIPTRVNNI